MMKYKPTSNRNKVGEPVLDLISGNTETYAARRLTKSVHSMKGLWQLAKMASIVRKTEGDIRKCRLVD